MHCRHFDKDTSNLSFRRPTSFRRRSFSILIFLLIFDHTPWTVPVRVLSRFRGDTVAGPMVPVVAHVASDHRRSVVFTTARRTNPDLISLRVDVMTDGFGHDKAVGSVRVVAAASDGTFDER